VPVRDFLAFSASRVVAGATLLFLGDGGQRAQYVARSVEALL
jgi:hypothetical protein